jgi:hypothetical protein
MKIEVLGGACAFARRETVEISVCEGLFVKPLRLRRQYLSDHAVRCAIGPKERHLKYE